MESILFLCLGDSRIVGDSLGPLIGTFINQYKNIILNSKNVKVIGTMEYPVIYTKVNQLKKHINENNSLVIVIDSALGSDKNIGKIIIDNSLLYAGSGLNKGKCIRGDITIRGIVGKNYNNVRLNINELKNVSEKNINQMASKIIFTIVNMMDIYKQKMC